MTTQDQHKPRHYARGATTACVLLIALGFPSLLCAQEVAPEPIEEQPVDATTPVEEDEKDSEGEEQTEEVEEDDETTEPEVVESSEDTSVPPAVEEQKPPPKPLTPEEEIKKKFGLDQQVYNDVYGLEYEYNDIDNSGRKYWYVSENIENPRTLLWDEQITCVESTRQFHILHMQCEHDEKHCVVAELYTPKRQGQDASAWVPSNKLADRSGYCHTTIKLEDLELLRSQGYTFEAAVLEAPYGYTRDARGRLFQTNFDLRSRAILGVYYTGLMQDDQGYQHGLTLETRSTHEHYSRLRGKRHRFRFLEGRLALSPMRVNATAFEYERGRSGKSPLFYITEFFGEPSRHDIYMNIGYGISLLRYDYRDIGRALEVPSTNEDGDVLDTQSFLDIGHTWLQWELLQGLGLEDYFCVQIGGGFGSRTRGSDALYVYPELGFKAKWLSSPRGLFELSTEGKARMIVEPSTDTTAYMASARASAEWIFISVSDQPISLYAEPEVNYLSYKGGTDPLTEVRVLTGIRFSLFTPAPKNPKFFKDKGYE